MSRFNLDNYGVLVATPSVPPLVSTGGVTAGGVVEAVVGLMSRFNLGNSVVACPPKLPPEFWAGEEVSMGGVTTNGVVEAVVVLLSRFNLDNSVVVAGEEVAIGSKTVEIASFWSLIARASQLNEISSGAVLLRRIVNPLAVLSVTKYSIPLENIISSLAVRSTGEVVELSSAMVAETIGSARYGLSKTTDTLREPLSTVAVPPVSEVKYGRPKNVVSEMRAMVVLASPIELTTSPPFKIV